MNKASLFEQRALSGLQRNLSLSAEIVGFARCRATCSLDNKEWLRRSQPGVACILSLGSAPVRPNLRTELSSES